MDIQGRLKQITDIENILTKSGNSFAKRSIILDCSRTDEWTGDVYTNILCFEVPPAKVSEYDQYKAYEGSVVKIRFALNGREVVNGMGESKYFTTLRCLELIPQQQIQAQPQPTIPQQTQATSRPAVQNIQPQQPITQASVQQSSENDLPF